MRALLRGCLQALVTVLALSWAGGASAQFAPGACPVERPRQQDLTANEGRPPLGHTIARHVGRTDADLRDRLEREPRISAASTFPDMATAQCVIDRTLSLADSRRRIDRWLADDERTLVLRWRGRETVGRIMGRDGRLRTATEATVVLRKVEGRPWVILTAYPDD
jgi:hypothetical protein